MHTMPEVKKELACFLLPIGEVVVVSPPIGPAKQGEAGIVAEESATMARKYTRGRKPKGAACGSDRRKENAEAKSPHPRIHVETPPVNELPKR